MGSYYGWAPYVPVARRRAQARRRARELAGQGHTVCPVEISGRTIARTFWGKAWCKNLESYSDFENRLPRGRTYVRNGSVVDLQIRAGRVTALVSGSDIYKITIAIKSLPKTVWKKITKDCSESIDSLIDLLQGRLSDNVMKRLTRQQDGLFPKPAEIDIDCSCPDWAVLCKHAAAVLYGVGARLDDEPDLLFTLRDVDHLELISQAVSDDNLDAAVGQADASTLDADDLGDIFGIDIDVPGSNANASSGKAGRNSKRSRKKKATSARVKTTRKKTTRSKAIAAKKSSSVVKRKSNTSKKGASATKAAAKKKATRATKKKATVAKSNAKPSKRKSAARKKRTAK